MRPIFIPEPQILSKIYWKCHIIFQNCYSFQANVGNFGIRLMKLGLFSHQFKKIWKYDKYDPCLYHDSAQNKGSSLYQEADFETHFSGTSFVLRTDPPQTNILRKGYFCGPKYRYHYKQFQTVELVVHDIRFLKLKKKLHMHGYEFCGCIGSR